MGLKYLALRKGDTWLDYGLLSTDRLLSIIAWNEGLEAFCSMQDHTEDGETIDCPIFADFDGKDALEDVRYAVYLIREVFDICPYVFFSGGKGYHLLIPYRIHHPFCHLIAKFFMDHLGHFYCLDPKVYRFRSMFRVPNTIHRSGLYKIPLTEREVFHMKHEDIKDLAGKPRDGFVYPDIDLKKFEESSDLDFILKRAHKEAIPDFKVSTWVSSGDFADDITPCIQKILTSVPEEGECNQTGFLLARFFKRAGLSMETALSIMYENPNFKEHFKEVEKIFRSTYGSMRPTHIGCKNSLDADMMQRHCDKSCRFLDDKVFVMEDIDYDAIPTSPRQATKSTNSLLRNQAPSSPKGKYKDRKNLYANK